MLTLCLCLKKMSTYHNSPETTKEIPLVFHNGSTYDYHFINKELAEEFDGQLECLGENTEKYLNDISVPIKKQITKIDEDGSDKIVIYDICMIYRTK